MWRPLFIILLLISMLSPGAFAQDAQLAAQSEHRLNTVSLTVYGLAPVAVYERIVPLGEHFGAIGSVGAFYYGTDYLGYSLGASLYMGSPKHKGELGAVYLNETLPMAYGAYRYTGDAGLFVRGGLGYAFMGNEESESGIVPLLAVGYAF